MEWISVKDRLPDEYIDVLTYDQKNDRISDDYIIDLTPERKIWARCCSSDERQSNITHWMPILKKP